jgi:hypothetical protein
MLATTCYDLCALPYPSELFPLLSGRPLAVVATGPAMGKASQALH